MKDSASISSLNPKMQSYGENGEDAMNTTASESEGPSALDSGLPDDSSAPTLESFKVSSPVADKPPMNPTPQSGQLTLNRPGPPARSAATGSRYRLQEPTVYVSLPGTAIEPSEPSTNMRDMQQDLLEGLGGVERKLSELCVTYGLPHLSLLTFNPVGPKYMLTGSNGRLSSRRY